MKKNLEYYRHDADSHNHPKFKMLRLKYGWEGEGKFWALNNIVAKSENCRLNLNQGYNKAMAASDLQFSMEEFELYLNYLSSECKLIKIRKGIISTDTTQENFKKVHGDRLDAQKRYYKKTSAENVKTSGEKKETSAENLYKPNKSKSNQIKPNQIKLNKIKPNKTGRVDFLKKEEGDEDQDQKQNNINGKADEYFTKFWNFYNRREGKREQVRQVFNDLIRTEIDYKNLITATRNYNDLVRDRPIGFVKLPINFISTYKDFIKINN